uniref:Uncharacterized protein n=1 Tax=Anguilla anguilla TaxID=7936 RepID=A0A0E9XUS3_ANGAN
MQHFLLVSNLYTRYTLQEMTKKKQEVQTILSNLFWIRGVISMVTAGRG